MTGAHSDAPRFEKMPDCPHTPTAHLRYYKFYRNGQRVAVMEQLFLDGWEKPFWAPVPVVENFALET